VSCLRLSCCIHAFIFCVHYLCLIGRVYVLYVGHVDKSSLYETLFHFNILSRRHHQYRDTNKTVIQSLKITKTLRIHLNMIYCVYIIFVILSSFFTIYSYHRIIFYWDSLCIHLYTCMYIYMYVYIYMHIYICIYIHIYILMLKVMIETEYMSLIIK
jgi:hypothetical protein